MFGGVLLHPLTRVAGVQQVLACPLGEVGEIHRHMSEHVAGGAHPDEADIAGRGVSAEHLTVERSTLRIDVLEQMRRQTRENLQFPGTGREAYIRHVLLVAGAYDADERVHCRGRKTVVGFTDQHVEQTHLVEHAGPVYLLEPKGFFVLPVRQSVVCAPLLFHVKRPGGLQRERKLEQARLILGEKRIEMCSGPVFPLHGI